MDYLFVYGTLLRGEERDGMVLALPAQPAVTRGRLHMVPAGYPALEVTPDGKEISGELLTLESPAVLTLLDLIEGVADGLYSRIRIAVRTEEETVPAWAYTMGAAQLRRARCRAISVQDWRLLKRRR